MKTNSPVAFLFFILFFVAALFAFSRADDEYVRNSDGDLAYLGGTYYLKAAESEGAVAGATIKNPDGTYSLGVVELLNNSGNPVRFNNSSLHRSSYFTTDTALNISFDPLPNNTSTKDPQWIAVYDIEFGYRAVMVGNASEYDDPISGWFQFNTYNPNKFYYYLVFCTGNSHYCEYIGLKEDGQGNTRLVLEDEKPFVVKLVKATTSDNVASHISMVL